MVLHVSLQYVSTHRCLLFSSSHSTKRSGANFRNWGFTKAWNTSDSGSCTWKRHRESATNVLLSAAACSYLKNFFCFAQQCHTKQTYGNEKQRQLHVVLGPEDPLTGLSLVTSWGIRGISPQGNFWKKITTPENAFPGILGHKTEILGLTQL